MPGDRRVKLNAIKKFPTWQGTVSDWVYLDGSEDTLWPGLCDWHILYQRAMISGQNQANWTPSFVCNVGRFLPTPNVLLCDGHFVTWVVSIEQLPIIIIVKRILQQFIFEYNSQEKLGNFKIPYWSTKVHLEKSVCCGEDGCKLRCSRQCTRCSQFCIKNTSLMNKLRISMEDRKS